MVLNVWTPIGIGWKFVYHQMSDSYFFPNVIVFLNNFRKQMNKLNNPKVRELSVEKQQVHITSILFQNFLQNSEPGGAYTW